MSWPSPPYPFGNATSPEQLSYLDIMFDQVASMIAIPCSAGAGNAITLTPLPNCPALAAYKELCGFRFLAASTSTGPVTAQFMALAALPVYRADGVTQFNAGDILSGYEYIFRFSDALNSGSGGFIAEFPGLAAASTPGVNVPVWYEPGGRLTLQSSVPVPPLNANMVSQAVWYTPFHHCFVPIFNGSTMQMYQFTAGPSDTTGLSCTLVNLAVGAYDLYATLVTVDGVGTLPVLVSGPAWTTPGGANPVRALTNSVFQGVQTNSAAGTFLSTLTQAGYTIEQNMATLLGTVYINTFGQSQFTFGTVASGGSPSLFLLCNTYQKVGLTCGTQDTQAGYAWAGGARQAGGAASGNYVQFVQSDSERPVSASYFARSSFPAGGGGGTAYAATGIGFDSNTVVQAMAITQDTSNNAQLTASTVPYQVNATGFHTIYAMEGADGAHPVTFNSSSNNILSATIWC